MTRVNAAHRTRMSEYHRGIGNPTNSHTHKGRGLSHSSHQLPIAFLIRVGPRGPSRIHAEKLPELPSAGAQLL